MSQQSHSRVWAPRTASRVLKRDTCTPVPTADLSTQPRGQLLVSTGERENKT